MEIMQERILRAWVHVSFHPALGLERQRLQDSRRQLPSAGSLLDVLFHCESDSRSLASAARHTQTKANLSALNEALSPSAPDRKPKAVEMWTKCR
jgi:hypothetical protein